MNGVNEIEFDSLLMELESNQILENVTFSVFKYVNKKQESLTESVKNDKVNKFLENKTEKYNNLITSNYDHIFNNAKEISKEKLPEIYRNLVKIHATLPEHIYILDCREALLDIIKKADNILDNAEILEAKLLSSPSDPNIFKNINKVLNHTEKNPIPALYKSTVTKNELNTMMQLLEQAYKHLFNTLFYLKKNFLGSATSVSPSDTISSESLDTTVKLILFSKTENKMQSVIFQLTKSLCSIYESLSMDILGLITEFNLSQNNKKPSEFLKENYTIDDIDFLSLEDIANLKYNPIQENAKEIKFSKVVEDIEVEVQYGDLLSEFL